jgi:D-alanyl-D-alanine carboxypeptidase-like protein
MSGVRVSRGAAVALLCLAAIVAAGAPAGAKPHHQPPFKAKVKPLSKKMQRTMTGVSWKPGCPVPLEDLRAVKMRFWGFDGRAHKGVLIVNADVAGSVVRAFGKLYDARFPIRRMEPVDVYGGSDDASMAADNTSAFNCRPITGTTDRWSNHSYGRAIDINTIENPYVKGTTVLPPAGAGYLDRADVRPGMIVAGDVVTAAFAAEGFGWGGDYTSLKDYQHFERVP